MKLQTYFKASAAPAVLGLALLAQPAMAQETDEEAAEAPAGAIVVTGSRISNPNLELASPVSVVSSDDLELAQTNVAEEFLRELPSAVPSIGSAVNNGNGGASFVNLRGVGSNRNLVLLDGRRFTPADTTGRVDLNNIPLAVIERTEILTGGATTTYGADAIGGVVNFITKRDFEGLEATASQQITEQGDGNVFRVDATIGANFDDGRGNAVLSIGYQNQDAVYQGDRDFSVFNISSYSGQPGGSSNAVPAVIVGGGSTGQINADGTDVVPGTIYEFFNFNPYNIFLTPFERFNIYGSARYEVSDDVEVFTQATFSKQTVSTIIAPGGSFFNTYAVPLSNPYIPTAILNRLCTGAGLDAAGCATAAAATGPTDAGYREVNIQVRRRSVEAGTRDFELHHHALQHRGRPAWQHHRQHQLGSVGHLRRKRTASASDGLRPLLAPAELAAFVEHHRVRQRRCGLCADRSLRSARLDHAADDRLRVQPVAAGHHRCIADPVPGCHRR